MKKTTIKLSSLLITASMLITGPSFARDSDSDQFTYSQAAKINAVTAIGEIGFITATSMYYESFTTRTPFDFAPAAKVLDDAEIERIVRMVERSPLAGFGLGEAGGARIYLDYDEEQFLQSMGRKNANNILQQAANAADNNLGKANMVIGMSPEGADAAKANMDIADSAKAGFNNKELNLRTLGGTETPAPEAVKSLLQELKVNGVHVRKVQVRGYLPRAGGAALGTLNIVLAGSALSNTLHSLTYAGETAGYSNGWMNDSCDDYKRNEQGQKVYEQCKADTSLLKALMSSSDFVFYNFVLDEEQTK